MSPQLPPDAAANAGEPPNPKDPPPLDLRAPRPRVVRIRGPFIRLLALSAAGLVAGALTWAFVIQPELRASAFERRAAQAAAPGVGAARPLERIREQPARYDHLAASDGLPPPRGRSDPEEPASSPAPIGRPAPPARPRSSGPSPAEAAAASSLFFTGAGPVASGAAATQAAPGGSIADRVRSEEFAAVYSPHGLIDPLSPWELKAGALLPATLLTAVDTGRPGPVVALVSQDVFDSITGRHRLVPQGARLIGRQEGDSAWGERRAFVVWERLILPNGRSVRLADAPGVDAQGAPGVRGQADRRLIPLGIATLFAGAITTLGEFARGGDRDGRSWPGSAGDAAAIEAAQVGGRLVDRELQVRPSIRVAPGAPVRVLITRDLVLEPYAP